MLKSNDEIIEKCTLWVNNIAFEISYLNPIYNIITNWIYKKNMQSKQKQIVSYNKLYGI